MIADESISSGLWLLVFLRDSLISLKSEPVMLWKVNRGHDYLSEEWGEDEELEKRIKDLVVFWIFRLRWIAT